MKQKLHSAINDFISTLNTMFKIGAAEFVKKNFHDIVDNCWEDKKSDMENLEGVKSIFELNEKLNSNGMGNPEAAKVFRAFIDGWLVKIEV